MIRIGIIRFILVFSIFLIPVWIYYFLNTRENKEVLLHTIHDRMHATELYAGGSSLSFAIRDSNNVADLSEPYLFTLKKIQLLKPEKVILSIGTHYFLKDYDQVYEDGLLTKASYQFLLTTLSEEEEHDVHSLMRTETRIFYFIQKILPFIGTKMTSEDRSRILGGDYYTGNTSKISTFLLDARIKKLFPEGRIIWSDQQWHYLERILIYCAENNIKISLLAAPVNANLLQKYPKGAIELYERKLKNYIETYNIGYADYTNLPMADSCFFDGDHLNDIGAESFMHTYHLK